MLIAIDHGNAGQPCTVCLDDYRVPFGSAAQAQAFVSQLRKRIAAPHGLPHPLRPAVQSKFHRPDAVASPLVKSA